MRNSYYYQYHYYNYLIKDDEVGKPRSMNGTSKKRGKISSWKF